MLKTPSARKLWEQFQAEAIPKSAPDIQKREMQKAFYVGMASLLGTLENLDESLSEKEGAAILEGYKQELLKALEPFTRRSDRP